MHCISTYRYPQFQTLHHNKIAEWLLEAPKIAQSRAPFYWTYLDRPLDGMIIQTWQPEAQLGTSFASDGYAWVGPELSHVMQIEGVGELHIYQQSAGYAPGEPIAAHARRRYRLVSRNPAQHANPDLWLIHYYTADPNDRIATNVVPPDPRTQQTMQVRAYLNSQGQITVKEFMLADRSKWPQISFPGRGPQRSPAYFSPIQQRTPVNMAYQTQTMTPGPSAKRARTHASQPLQAAAPVEVFDDEEDTSRGDMFDHMTPREVAQSRFIQNQEWMEEVLSPIPTSNLVPVDLGLGLGGSLKPVTDGIFETYNSSKHASDPSTEVIGHLEKSKAEEFKKRALEKIETENKEIEHMARRHARQMAKLLKNAALVEAEKALRDAVNDPSDTGAEYWRLEGKLSSNDDEEEQAEDAAKKTASAKVDDIVAKLETSLGLHTAAVKELRRIQDGGLEERAPEPPQIFEPLTSSTSALNRGSISRPASAQGGLLNNDHDLDMGTAGGLLDQFHTGYSAATSPGQAYTPHMTGMSAPPSNAASPMPMGASMSQQIHQQNQQQNDVEMGGTGTTSDTTTKFESGDWVMVAREGAAASQPAVEPSQPAQNIQQGMQQSQTPAAKPAPILPPGYGPGGVRTSVPAPTARPTPPPQTQAQRYNGQQGQVQGHAQMQGQGQAPMQQHQQQQAQMPKPNITPILPPGHQPSPQTQQPQMQQPRMGQELVQMNNQQQQQPTQMDQSQQSMQQQAQPQVNTQSPGLGGAAQTPAVPSPAPQHETNTSTPNFNMNSEPVDFSGLEDLGTGGFEEGMDLVDDSAFGEAFHGVEPRSHDEQHEGDSM